MAGYDTASYVYDVASAAGSTFGTPAFWLRYFSPSQTTPLNTSASNAVAECRAIWNSGGHYLGPITVPTQSRLSGTSAMGQADAQTLASALAATRGNVSTLRLPSNRILYCWLDQEPGTGLSLSYWNGWSGYIDGYVWPYDGSLPLYPCMYTNPCNPQPNCSVFANPNAYACFAIWSYEPQKCSYSVRNPPPFAATTCAGCSSYSGTPTQLWQFAQPGSCHYSVNVDQDVGGGINYSNYCFNVTASP
jgi:hypothetical protein